jgi:hypothetical protein
MPVLGEVEAVLSIGDPDIAPGLTAPVQDALRNLLADNPWEADPPHAKKYAEQIISSLFWKPHVLSYYLRLEPLCATLAVLIGDPEDHGSASLGLAAIRALESAPEGALAGPLKPWIAAFSARIDSGCSFPRHDRELVSRVLAKYAPGSVGSIALAGLQARL